MLTINEIPATIAEICPCSKYGCKPTTNLTRYQFDKILREEKERIREANTIDLTADDDLPTKKQRKMTDYLNKIPYT